MTLIYKFHITFCSTACVVEGRAPLHKLSWNGVGALGTRLPGRTRTRFNNCFCERRLGGKPLLKQGGMSAVFALQLILKMVKTRRRKQQLQLVGRRPDPLVVEPFHSGLQAQT